MSSRRVIGGLIRFGLVILTLVLIVAWGKHKFSSISSHDHVRVETQAPPDSLGPGDMRLYNADSTVDVVLVGDKIMAGLSSKTVNKVKGELENSRLKDTAGLGGMIGQIVKTSVAGAIGTHAVFPLADIKNIEYTDGHLRVQYNDGSDKDVFGNTKVNNEKVSNTFNEADAKRFVDAVRARKGLPSTP